MRLAAGLAVGLIIGIAGTFLVMKQNVPVVSPIIASIARPLDRYAIPNLASVSFTPSDIRFEEATATTSGYTVWRFSYTSDGPDGKPDPSLRVSGLAHVPAQAPPSQGYPVIIQFRGYADPEAYYPGMGTEHSAEVFAENGYLSLAPDFLGYGTSSNPSTDVFEERFQTYTAALTLLSSVSRLPNADPTRVGVWGHSNGGQVALTVLETANQAYPASLWAPVSSAFPYSILYYTDEADDHGKALRRALARFEAIYDTDLYTLTNYFDRIRGPVVLHQGTSDDAVPVKWSEALKAALKAKKVDITDYTYPGADHNLTPGWNTVMERDLNFFRTRLSVK